MGLETGIYISDLNSSNPVGSDAKSQGDDHIRLIKSTVKTTFPNISGAVTPTHTELNYVDGVTSAIQTQINTLTSAVAAVIPSGTVMVFFQAAAPTGWTKSTAHNDKALRVVSGSGGGSGGTDDLSTPPSTAHTHTGPSHTHTGPSHTHTTGDFTLTVNEMPAHAHTISGSTTGGGNGIYYPQVASSPVTTSTVGGGAAHNHGTTGASGTGATGASGTDATGSASPTAFAPKYIDVIICAKD